jgi:dTDP-4-dehydrorhamnose 3,5-epimerase
MEIEELEIKGSWLARSPVHHDDRGYFREWFKSKELELATGFQFSVEQANISVSNKGVLRGIHYSLAKEGQGKWVTCVSGSVWDVIVDIRPGSPTFKRWIGIELTGGSGDSILISEGLGHGFISLEDKSTIAYLLTSKYSPNNEFEISPLDPELNISWPKTHLFLSEKDLSAPTLKEQLDSGNLEKKI